METVKSSRDNSKNSNSKMCINGGQGGGTAPLPSLLAFDAAVTTAEETATTAAAAAASADLRLLAASLRHHRRRRSLSEPKCTQDQ